MNKENTHQPSTSPTQSETSVSQGLAGVRKAARENKELKFTALLHHLTVKTIRKRMRAKLRDIKWQLRQRLHDPVAQTGEWLKSVAQGYYNYHAVPGNLDSLGIFRERVIRLWRRTLIRRSQTHEITWERMKTLADRWLPKPRELHPSPVLRFAANHPS